MSFSVNKAILIGRLGKDPVINYTGSGQAVANVSLATDESYKDKDGVKQKKTEWHNLVIWGNSVENFVKPYLHKGDLVYVEGKLQTRSWEKDGEKKYTTEINVTDIKAAPSQDGEPAAPARQNNSRSSSRPATTHKISHQEIDSSDIPF